MVIDTHWTDAAFVGGHPALDFVNTVDNHDKDRDRSRIGDWPAFRSWWHAATLRSGDRPPLPTDLPIADRARLLADVHRLREASHAVLRAVAAGEEMPQPEAADLERWIKEAVGRASFSRRGGNLAWSASGDGSQAASDALALAVEDFLRTGDLERLRECGRCSWLFLDHGRGRGRRWCDMRTCGNRAKAETFRRR